MQCARTPALFWGTVEMPLQHAPLPQSTPQGLQTFLTVLLTESLRNAQHQALHTNIPVSPLPLLLLRSSHPQGMLNAEARRALSKLAINVFTPALMITKLGAHTDLASALSLWYIGANVILR